MDAKAADIRPGDAVAIATPPDTALGPAESAKRVRRVLIVTDAWQPQVNGVVRTMERVSENLPALGAQAVFLTLAQKAKDFSLQHSMSLGGWSHRLAWHIAMRLRAAGDARKKHEREAIAVNSSDANAVAAKELDWEKLRPVPEA